MKLIIYIAIILAGISYIHAQGSEKARQQLREYQKQDAKRTAQEKKLDGSVYVGLVNFEHATSEGVPLNQAISSFVGFQKDDSSRILVVIKIHGGNGAAQSAIVQTGGRIWWDYLGRIYSWVRPKALRSLIEVESITYIEVVRPARHK